MNIEDQIVIELEAAISTVPSVAPAPLGVIESRGRRRLLAARAGHLAVGVAVFAVMVGVSIAVGRIGYLSDVAGSPADSVALASAPPTTVTPVSDGRAVDGRVIIAGESFPVGELVGAFAGVPMYFGEAAPAPRFDPSLLGREIRLEFETANVGDPDVLSGPTIYVGEAGGVSVFVNEIALGDGPTKCLWMAGSLQVCGDFGAFRFDDSPATPPPGTMLFAAWLGVPDGTSVVVVRSNGVDIVWQRPVSGVVVIPLSDPAVYQLAAFDESGVEIESVDVSLTAANDQEVSEPGGPTTTVP